MAPHIRRPVKCCLDVLSAAVLLCTVTLCCSDIATAALKARTAHHYDAPTGRMVQSAGPYHVTHPVVVSPEGWELSHDVRRWYYSNQRRRQRRSLIPDPATHYRLSLDEVTTVQLEMRPNRHLVAPGFVVERRTTSGAVRSIGRRRRHCHLRGHVVGQRDNSSAALSTCDGLLGYISTGGQQYLVEPASDSGGARPHRVYKRHLVTPPAAVSDPSRTPACRVHRSFESGVEQRADWERERVGTGTGSRSRRSVSTERNVETLVVADTDVVDFYATDDIETYLLTVMNGVAELYHDASIGNAINVILVRMIILEENDPGSVHFNISADGDNSLKSFCTWQLGMNPLNESHPNHHDVAVLLTRRNICSENETCNTLGLAEVAGMCQPTRSCNINQDTGLSVSYTIAHELGHNFAMNHDGPGNGCSQPDGLRQHVMAPNLINDVTPVVWSRCSRRDITKFLDRDWGSCLDDEPTDHEFNYPQVPPGALYDATHQCKLLYGPSAVHCKMGSVCEALWCNVEDRCVTRLEPAAEGTMCGGNANNHTGMWCSAGECVEAGTRPRAVDGSWGDWGPWSPCSRSCDTGVKTSERHCDSPVPANGGKYCVGERRRYKICRPEACESSEGPSFRAEQCTKYNTVPYQEHNYTWSPVLDPAIPCQLVCKPADQHFTVVLSDTVLDGTPCRPGSEDICINGKCRRIGCDGVLDSSAQADRCGVCHGNGSLCHSIRDVFTAQPDNGYVTITAVPAGARSIRVEEQGDGEGYFLAVTGISNDTHYLNSNWFIQWSGEYPAAGSVIYYLRKEQEENIFIPGPLKQSIILKLLLQGSGAEVRYEYTVPGHEGAETDQVFSWKHDTWSGCSEPCGGGIQTARAVCTEREAGRVEDTYCPGNKPADKTIPCNIHLCPARWWTGPWQPCVANCESPALRQRSVFCVRSSGPSEMLALPDRDCENATLPTDREPCEAPSIDCSRPDVWNTSPWDQDCGGGDPCRTQMRRVWCAGGAGRCSLATRPRRYRLCDRALCQRAHRRRPHTSVSDPAGQLTLLLGQPPPRQLLSAHVGREADRLLQQLRQQAGAVDLHPPSAAANHSWLLGYWRQCSALCGEGTRERSVLCMETVSGEEVEMYRCGLPIPDLFTTCHQPCLNWTVDVWSPCSSMCDAGRRTRQVTCPKPGACDPKSRPVDSLPCWERDCAEWHTGDWKPCSVTCGGGYTTRPVKCMHMETGEPDDRCIAPRPPRKRACATSQCPAAKRTAKDENRVCKDVIRTELCRNRAHLCARRHFRRKCCATCSGSSRYLDMD